MEPADEPTAAPAAATEDSPPPPQTPPSATTYVGPEYVGPAGVDSIAALRHGARKSLCASLGPDTAYQPPPERRADFALVLWDVSTYNSSKARRFIKSMWLFGGSSFANVEVALQQLVQGLQAAGFEAERQDDHSVTPGSPSREASASELLLLLTSTHAKLRRAHYTEQLDAWIVQRGVGEFAPADADPSAFSPARRTALLYPSLARALPELQRDVLRGSDLLQLHRVFPPHDRRFNLGLMRHLAQRLFLQAQVLHQLRNVYGEKVAFLFAFRNFYQRCLLVPALLGVLLSLSQRCFSRVRSPAQARTPPTSTAARSLA